MGKITRLDQNINEKIVRLSLTTSNMEKTTTIFIAGTTFSLTESAHAKLAEYLATLKNHFAHESSHDEIVRDIESRIAEKLMQKKGAMVVSTDIEAIIVEIGEPAQLDDMDDSVNASVKATGQKKLYRNMDDAWLGGVASGIAVYFDINALWVRLGFAIATLLWGASIILYIVLWILVPEAKTAGQKLDMHGIHATLENISRRAKERAEEVRERGIVKKFFDGMGHILHTIFRIFGKIIGIALTVVPILSMVGLTIVLGTAITNWTASFNDFPLRGAVPDMLILLGAILIYIAILIPLVLLSASGIRIIRQRSMMPVSVVFGLVGMWFFVLIAGGIVGTNVARHYAETLAIDPQYQMETRKIDVPTFAKISIADNAHVTIKKGDAQEVTVRARIKDHENVLIGVKNGLLVIEQQKNYPENCFFVCDRGVEEIIVTTPDLDAISIKNARVDFDEYSSEAMHIEMSGGSLYGAFNVPVLEMTTDRAYVHASIITNSLTVNAKRTRFYLDGSAQNAKLYLVNARFGDELFIIDSAELDTKNTTITAKILEQVGENNEVMPLELESNSVQ
jgi:phage shock protein PspC (stress-responsive transcriptional regulator)